MPGTNVITFHGLLIGVTISLGLATATAQPLYDGSQGSLPTSQGWNYAEFPHPAGQSLTGQAVRLDTLESYTEYAGYAQLVPTSLDRTTGFRLSFSVQVETESHLTSHRAGFSLILLSQDRRGIELGFWTNRVFAQADSPLFTHAEEAEIDAASAFVNFDLNLLGTNYTLYADGRTVLSGPIRDYTPFAGLIDPYENPNLIFFGDDTTSAQAAFRLQRMVLVTGPRLQPVGRDVLQWSGPSNGTYTVLASADLQHWRPVATVFSATPDYRFTNQVTEPHQFFRVSVGP